LVHSLIPLSDLQKTLKVFWGTIRVSEKLLFPSEERFDACADAIQKYDRFDCGIRRALGIVRNFIGKILCLACVYGGNLKQTDE
jgi:hypothetical protein